MRGALVVAGLMLLAGCQREPNFDERYARADKAVHEKAAEIDAELAERERQASEAAAALPTAAANAATPDPTPRR
jgi:hypothetical protein